MTHRSTCTGLNNQLNFTKRKQFLKYFINAKFQRFKTFELNLGIDELLPRFDIFLLNEFIVITH